MINVDKLNKVYPDVNFTSNKVINVVEIDDRKTHWPSIYIGSVLSFIGCIQIGLYFSSVWPYLQETDKSTTENFLGIVIASLGLGNLIASPIFGRICHKLGKIKPMIYVGFSFMFLSNFMYAIAEMLPPSGSKYCILSSRFLAGIGVSFISLLKAYAVSASLPCDRSKAIAYISGGCALGTITGPAIQLFFTSLGPHGYQIIGKLFFNLYTGPAILACLINLITYFLLFFCFTETRVGIIDKKITNDKGITLPPADRIATFLIYATCFCKMFVVNAIETVSPPFALTIFAFSKVEAVRYTALAEFLRCLLAFIIYFLYIKFNLGKRCNCRKVVIAALGGFLIFHLTTYSWPFLSNHMQLYNNNNDLQINSNSNSSEFLGCIIHKYHWCQTFNYVNPYIYYLSFIIFIGMSYTNLDVSLSTLFSKIIGPRPQTIQQGWFQVGDSIGRILGPILISAFYVKFGPRWIWNIQILLIIAIISCWIIFRNRMIPLKIPSEYADYNDFNDPDAKKDKWKHGNK